MRRRATADVIPEDLQAYDWKRWVKAAIDAHEVNLRHIPAAERTDHWYAVRVIGPSYYRAALRDAVGARVGDNHFFHVLKPCPMGSVPAGWTMPTKL